MLKQIYNFLHPSKEQSSLLFTPTGRPMLLTFGILLMGEEKMREYEIWLAPNWSKPQLWELIYSTISPFLSWINESKLISLKTEI